MSYIYYNVYSFIEDGKELDDDGSQLENFYN